MSAEEHGGNRQKVSYDFQFVIPTDDILQLAKESLLTADQDVRDVAKALIDTTAVTLSTQTELAQAATRDGTCDLTPYFDHWIGDAIDAAERLVASRNDRTADMSQCLINQSKAIAVSKESFMAVEKARQQGKP